MKLLQTLIYGMLLSQLVVAQLNLLTYREGEAVVEHLPDVRSAEARGLCPFLSGGYDEIGGFTFQVRSSCGSTRGQLVGNYRVDRRTALVTTFGDETAPVGDVQSVEYAKRVAAAATGRVLSVQEAKCLAVEAAKTLPGWSGDKLAISADETDGVRTGELRFTARNRWANQPVEMSWTLDVNLGTARVRDYATGLDIMSSSLGNLSEEMFDLREPLALSDADVLSIVLRLNLRTFVEGFQRGCTLYAAGPFRSDETQVGLSCGGKQSANSLALAINVESGRVFDAETRSALDSPESTSFAQELLHEKAATKVRIRGELTKACPAR